MTERGKFEALSARCREAPRLLLLLDYDGTLVPFTRDPRLAVPDPALLALLGGLGSRPGTDTHIVSGRESRLLEEWFDGLPIGLHAEHGSWSRPARGGAWVRHESGRPVPFDALLPILNRYAERTPGVIIERKTTALAWHYRSAPAELGRRQAEQMLSEVAQHFSSDEVNLLHGDMVVEIRPAGVHKGLIVTRLAAEAAPGTLTVALGDDATDEDMFRALGPEGVAVHVGPRPSMAEYRLSDVPAARSFLGELLRGG